MNSKDHLISDILPARSACTAVPCAQVSVHTLNGKKVYSLSIASSTSTIASKIEKVLYGVSRRLVLFPNIPTLEGTRIEEFKL
jgi:hypothetical protein